MAHKTVKLVHGAQPATLVPRQQLRRPPEVDLLRLPPQMEGIGGRLPLPTPPGSLDYAQGAALPVLGNNAYGDCFYAAVCHWIQVATHKHGNDTSFDASQVVARYLDISGGDNGLDWSTMMGEFGEGVLGPNGPHKQYALAGLDPNNKLLMQTALLLCGPIVFTLGVPDAWLQTQSRPGGVWDAGPGVRADDNNGHAVIFTGWDAKGYKVQTWGFSPPVTITYNGVRVCDPEASVLVGRDWFDGYDVSGRGDQWPAFCAFWTQLGGKELPDDPPWGDPTPNPTPEPVTRYSMSLSGSVEDGQVRLAGTMSGSVGQADPGETLRARLQGAKPDKLTPAQWQAIIQAILAVVEALMGQGDKRPE